MVEPSFHQKQSTRLRLPPLGRAERWQCKHKNKQQSATAEFKVEVFIRHASLKNNSDVRGKSNLTFICMSNRPTSLTKPSQTRLLCSNNCDETHTIHYHHARQCPSSSSLACEAKALVFIVRGNDRLHYFARQ